MADPVGVVAVVVLYGGLLLATIGLVGVLRRDDIFRQLHASGLVTGPAVLLVLIASVGTGRAEIITSAILVIAFILVTTPLASHAIAQAAHRRSVGETEGRSEPPRADEPDLSAPLQEVIEEALDADGPGPHPGGTR